MPRIQSALLLVVLSAAASAQTITNLGQITPYAVSDDGLVACGVAGQTAFRWSAVGGVELLPHLVGHSVSYAISASADGSAVAGYSQLDFSSAPLAVLWTGTSAVNLGTLQSAGSNANAVSADGLTVVGASGTLPFRWTAASGMQSLGLLPGWNAATPTAVTADGAIVAGIATTGSGPHLFRWTSAGGLESLSPLTGNAASACGISADGQTIAGRNGTQLYRWTQSGGLQLLGTLAGFQTMTPTGMTSDGSTIIGYASIQAFPVFTNQPFLWTQATGIIPLADHLTSQGVNLSGWDLTFAFDISADGRSMVGLGNVAGHQQGWHVRLPAAGGCYANCDQSTVPPVLNVADFTCFLQRFASGDAYANCDQSTTPPVLNVADFTCFLQSFASGCP